MAAAAPVLAILAAGASGCSEPAPAPAAPPTAALWGDLKPLVSVKELMKYMIDPLADNIFFSIRTEIDARGTVETAPRTEEDWDRIRTGAISLAEGIYLLKMHRPFTPPGEDNNPDYELTAAQITEKVQKDPVLWNAKIEALRNVGLEVLEIAKKKEVEALWDAAEDLDLACEGCHIEYWYPGDRALYERLDRRLRELPPPSRAPAPRRPGT
jgi:hypothetical protein